MVFEKNYCSLYKKIDLEYRDLVLDAAKNKKNLKIENSDLDHAKFLSSLLIENAKEHIRIVTGNLNKSFYSDENIISAFEDALNRKVRVDIIVAEKPESKNFVDIMKKRGANITQLNSEILVKNHFLISDNASFRLEHTHMGDLAPNRVRGFANFNEPAIVRNLIDIFDKHLMMNTNTIRP